MVACREQSPQMPEVCRRRWSDMTRRRRLCSVVAMLVVFGLAAGGRADAPNQKQVAAFRRALGQRRNAIPYDTIGVSGQCGFLSGRLVAGRMDMTVPLPEK